VRRPYRSRTPYAVIPDRRGSHRDGVQGLRDRAMWVVLAGKGHEDYQIIGGEGNSLF